MSETQSLWIWIGPPMMVVGIVALGFVIKSLIDTVKKAELCRVPLVERQEVVFPEAGLVILNEEGPRLTSRFSSLTYHLSAPDGSLILGQRILFRTRKSGFSTASVSISEYYIPRPGRYTFRIEPLGPPLVSDSEHAIVFTKPHTARMVAHILGLIASAAVFIVSLVFFALRLVGN